MILERNEDLILPGRNFLGRAANFTLSASAIGLLAGNTLAKRKVWMAARTLPYSNCAGPGARSDRRLSAWR